MQEGAEQHLEYALKHCHRNAAKNKSCIMYYLIPVKMLLGQLPSEQALKMYNLDVYAGIVQVKLICHALSHYF